MPGLLTIVLQGIVLSALFPMMRGRGSGLRRGLKFAALAGAFFWTSHVLAFVAKQEVPGQWAFVVLIGFVHRGEKPA